jgi:hypothetical protein
MSSSCSTKMLVKMLVILHNTDSWRNCDSTQHLNGTQSDDHFDTLCHDATSAPVQFKVLGHLDVPWRST